MQSKIKTKDKIEAIRNLQHLNSINISHSQQILHERFYEGQPRNFTKHRREAIRIIPESVYIYSEKVKKNKTEKPRLSTLNPTKSSGPETMQPQ